MKIQRAPHEGKVRESVVLDGYAYNKAFNLEPETPVVTKATYNASKDRLGFIAKFEKAGKQVWIDLDDLKSRVTDSNLFEQVVSSANELIMNVKIGFENGIPVVHAA